tara:strand:+ start:461 stop:1261 length:801 start_codon:yes stop_codon:yes gene_type:complete
VGGPGSGRRGAPRDTSGRFLSLNLALTGASEAAEDLDAMSQSAEKAVGSTKKLGDAVDKETQEIEENTTSLQKNRNTMGELLDQQTKKVIMLQATTSALNQTTGGLYKMIGGLEAWGISEEKMGILTQENVRKFEVLTGGLEIGLAIMTIHTTVTEVNTAARAKNAVATDTQTAAQLANNKALLANPYVALAVGIAAVLYGLYIFNKETGKVTDMVEGLNKALRDLIETFTSLGGLLDDNPLRKLVESDTMAGINNALRLESLGVG